jgi:hypothetical protein
MKSVIRTALRGGVAMLALSLATAGVAAAATKPEFKPVPTKKKFTVSGGTSYWGYGGRTIDCAKTSVTGEIDSAETVGNVVVVYTGCKSSGNIYSNCPVNSTGAKAEEIVTKPLDGELGTAATSQAPSGVGLLFKPESKTKWFELEENKCTGGATFTGKLAAEVVAIGKKQAVNELVLKKGTNGEKIKEITLDSGVVEKPELETAGSEMSIEATEYVTFEEPVEVT